MLKISKTVDYRGVISFEGKEVVNCSAAVFNGKISYMNQDIRDYELFSKKNIDVMNDLIDFQKKIMEDIKLDNTDYTGAEDKTDGENYTTTGERKPIE